MDNLPTLMTTAQVADLLQVKPQTVRRWRWSGDGPRYLRAGPRNGRVLYRLSEVESWLSARSHTSTSGEAVRATDSPPEIGDEKVNADNA